MLNEMTAPLWGLVIFILWVIAIAVLLIIVRIRHLATGGAIKDFAAPNDESLIWRLYRVHANLVENLPLYLGVMFLLTVRGVSGTGTDILIWIYIAFRLAHSIIHVARFNPILRVICLGIQFSCLIGLTAVGII